MVRIEQLLVALFPMAPKLQELENCCELLVHCLFSSTPVFVYKTKIFTMATVQRCPQLWIVIAAHPILRNLPANKN